MGFLLVWLTPDDPDVLAALAAELESRAGFHCVDVPVTSLLARMLPLPLPAKEDIPDVPDPMRSFQRVKVNAVRDALAAAGGNRSHAARLLGVTVRTVRSVIRHHPAEFSNLRPVWGRRPVAGYMQEPSSSSHPGESDDDPALVT